MARFNLEADYRIMLMAHWDTREFADQDPDPKNRLLPIIGANDGASGIAVLLTLAEIFHSLPPLNIGIDLLLVDGEDQGQKGDSESLGVLSTNDINRIIFVAGGRKNGARSRRLACKV